MCFDIWYDPFSLLHDNDDVIIYTNTCYSTMLLIITVINLMIVMNDDNANNCFISVLNHILVLNNYK